MQKLKIFKLGFIFVIIFMVVILLTNYYLNLLDTKSLVKDTSKEKSIVETRHESTILNPQYYSYNQKNQKLFIQADHANKDKKQINMSKLSGYIQLQNGMKLECKAQHGKIYTDIKKIILSDNITINSSNGGRLTTTELLVDYDKYQFLSDSKITLWYKNIVLTAMKFSFNSQDKIIRFSDSVKVKIKVNINDQQ